MSILMSCCPNAIGLYSSKTPVAMPLDNQPNDGLMPRFRDFRTTEDGPIGVYQEPLYPSGQLRYEASREPIGPRRLIVRHGLLHGVLEVL